MTDATADHPYAALLPRVQKPSRYVGGEHGEIRKDWAQVPARICLAFPDVYEVGMSHLGFKILYSLINREPDLLAERAYAPWVDMEAALRAAGQPLRSLENARALSEFDVIGFSLQFELTYTNVLQMLDLGGIALRAADRGEDAPLVIAGGPSATHPEPLAPFLDAVAIGDGEELATQILRGWTAGKRAGLSRAQRLRELARLRGVYVPSLYATELEAETGMHYVARALDEDVPLPVSRAFIGDISRFPFPKDGPTASTETVFDRVSVEIARGCTEGCRFCQAGMIYRPVRERDPEEIIDVIDSAVTEGGYDAASLTSLSTADYSAIAPLVQRVAEKLGEKRAKLSVSSLRAYGLSEDVLDDLQASGTKGLTFAPEAGSQRMRDVVNKNVTEEQLLETARRVFSRGWDKMKLYFMIGLPTEQDEDVIGIVQTGARARAVGRSMGKRSSQVTVSVSTHVPKPHTPFQWCAQDALAEVLRKQGLLKQQARATGVKLRMHDSRGTWIEGVLARGDRPLGDVLELAYKRGARFDSWDEQLRLDAWKSAFADTGVDPERYLGTIPTSARLPWDHIDVGLERGFLEKEYRKALRNRLSPPCGKAVGAFVHHTHREAHDADKKRLVCYDCGVACDMTQMRDRRGEMLVQLGAFSQRVKPQPVALEAGPELEASTAVPAVQEALSAATPSDFDPELTEPLEPSDLIPPPLLPVEALVRAGLKPARYRPAPAPNRRKPPARPEQGTPLRLRLQYEKLGRAAFASHLDLVRTLPRLFRRLQLPLYYSLGFAPKPVMVFGPALSLGVLSLAEYVDLKLAADRTLDVDDLPRRLSEACVDGVRFVAARELGPEDKKLGALIDEAVYVAAIPRAALEAVGVSDAIALQALIDDRRDGSLVVRRSIDGVGKRIDVGQYLLSARVGQGAEVLAQAGLRGELLPVELRLAFTPGGTAKAFEAVEALLGSADLPIRCVRAAMLCTRNGTHATPLELETLRAIPPIPAPNAETSAALS